MTTEFSRSFVSSLVEEALHLNFVLQEAAGMKYKLVAGSENGQSEHNLQREDHHLALR